MVCTAYPEVVHTFGSHRFLVAYHVVVDQGNELAEFVNIECAHGDDVCASY